MGKQTVACKRCRTSGPQAAQKIKRLFGSCIEHHQIRDKKQKSPAQVPGVHQYQNMEGCHGRGQHQIPELHTFGQTGGRKKYKRNLYKFRRLQAEPRNLDGQLGAVAGISEKGYHHQQKKTDASVNPRELLKKTALSYQNRNYQENYQGNRYHLELPDCTVVGKAGKDNKPQRQHQAHIV